MVEFGDLTQRSNFKDRKKGLVVFGILQIIFVGAAALSAFFIMIDVILPRIPDNSSAPPMNAAILVIFYFWGGVFWAVWAIWTGVGSIKARRWARVLILYSSWIELIISSIGGCISLLLLYHMYFKVESRSIVDCMIPWLMTIFSIIIPGVFIIFYGSKNVKATCQFRDSEIRWNDKYPRIVLAAILLFTVLTTSTELVSIFGGF